MGAADALRAPLTHIVLRHIMLFKNKKNNMDKLSLEIEALITTIIYMECKMDAILQLLEEKGIALDPDEIHSTTHNIHTVQGEVKRHKILCRIKDPDFDIG